MPIRKDGGSRAEEVGPAPIDGWIGSRIRFLRNQKGYRAIDLAAQIGITRQQLEKYEKGETRIHASRLWDIAQLMDVDPAWFYRDFKPMAAPTASGNQPPSGIFRILAARKVSSTTRNIVNSTMARFQPQPHTLATTTVASNEVMTMSPVTAIP